MLPCLCRHAGKGTLAILPGTTRKKNYFYEHHVYWLGAEKINSFRDFFVLILPQNMDDKMKGFKIGH